jgi:predicted ATPase
VGRAAIVRELSARLIVRRLVTLAGAGGIGKTTVALAVASQMLERFNQRVLFVDLAPVSDPEMTAATVSDVLRGCTGSEPALLILDNCEHLVDAVASVIEDVLSEAGRLHILATSREPLCVKGEQVFRLPALEAPLEAAGVTAEEALSYPAIELFVERAAAGAAYRLSAEDVPVLSEVCRKLDGNPLAIELAAARMDSLGLRGLAALISHRAGFLDLGSRTGPARHRTLAAALDWTYELLPLCERELLRRLSVLPGAFSLDVAIDAGHDSLSRHDVAGGLAGLVAKSLVLPEVHSGVAHFRLPETTRAYAAQKLAECDEAAASLSGATRTRGPVLGEYDQ